MYPRVDYSLAKRAVLRDYRSGRTGRGDICDAHPDLVRAANYSGERTDEACPVCGRGELLLVSYAYSAELKKENGRVWPRHDLAPLMKHREAHLYTVEVCTECLWNHLRSQLTLGRGTARREASK